MSNIILKIAECTRLCKEYSNLPLNAETAEKYQTIENKRLELKKQIDFLKAEIKQIRKECKAV